MSAWQRIRFRTFEAADPRPISFPPPGPYWVTGAGEVGDGREFAIVVAYVPTKDDLLKFWPEADLDWDGCDVQAREEIEFTSRFAKPEWWA